MNDTAGKDRHSTVEDNGLNSFQKLMRCWTTLAPYNAMQAIEISGMAHIATWQRAAEDVLSRLASQQRIPLLPPLDPIDVWGVGTACNDIIVRHLNTAFIDGQCPIRLCVVQNEDSFHLIMVYDHWLADSWSIRELMRCIYFQARDQAFTSEFTTMAASEQRAHWLPSGIQCLRQYVRHRRAARLNFIDPLDFKTGMAVRVLDAEFVVGVKQAAKTRGVSVHDIFVTIIARLMGELTQKDRYARRRLGHAVRDRVAIGSIVDIRKFLIQRSAFDGQANTSLPDDTGDGRQFGVSLGFTTTLTRSPEKAAMDELLQTVHWQHTQQKRRRSPVASLAAIEVARFFWNLYREKRHHAIFFSKNLPLLAGISNVNLTDQWMCRTETNAFEICNYFRVSPVGPLLPLVWATTTFKNRLTLCLTYRQTALNSAQAETLIGDFAVMLERFIRSSMGASEGAPD